MQDSEKAKGKKFFFEKKNQKTFALEITQRKRARARFTKVFCGAFLKKSDRLLNF
jgi:hypothetical protein